MNIWSCLWALIGIFATGEFYGLIDFLQIYPSVISNMFLLGLTGAVGQVNENISQILSEIKIYYSIEFYLSYY
jgi:hypothetical protein